MAIYHMNIRIGSKGKGQNAIAAAAYRSGEKLIDKETGLISDYTRKKGVVFSEICLCKNAPAEYKDRSVLWNAVHQIEKNKNAQLWREFEVALPKELSQEEQIATIRDFVKQLTDRGMCVDWSLHDKGDGNPHAHIMATMRSIMPDGSWAAKSKFVYDLDENGERIFQKVNKQGCKQYKSHKENYNNWNAAERVEEWRSAWAACCNARLSECNQIDHRSYARQGVNQIPTIHEGQVARKRVRQGLQSDRININCQIKKQNVLLGDIAKQLKLVEKAKSQWKEYSTAQNLIDNFKKCAEKVQKLNEQFKRSINPFKWKPLQEDISKAAKNLKKSAKSLNEELGVSLYYKNNELDYFTAPKNHINEIISRAEHILDKRQQQAEKSYKEVLKMSDDVSKCEKSDINKPLFSLEKLMSDEFKPTSEQGREKKKKELSL